VRLSHLYGARLLTAREIDAFAQALWSKLDATGFPADTHSLKNAVLLLPELQPGMAKEKLKAYLLATDFYRHAQEFVTPEQRGVQFGLSFGQQYLIKELCQATSEYFPKGETSSECRIDWSQAETISILEKVVTWWDDQKRFLLQAADNPFLSDSFRQDFVGLVDILGIVILPRIGKADDEHHSMVIRLITELEQAGIVALSVWPLVLSFKPELHGQVATRIQSALFLNDRKTIEGALLGLQDWLKYSSQAELPQPPKHYLDQFISIIATRRQPGLDAALLYLTDLIQSISEAFEERHLESVLLALDLLIEESDVKKNIGNIEIPDKPLFRIRAAKLAYQLSKYYQLKSTPFPRIIEKWQEICLSDALFQVRKAWAD
jgi:hypothetical protein